MSSKPSASLMPAIYSHRIADIQCIARAHGYAIAIHGSMQRDLDVVAFPWTKKAVQPKTLVKRLCDGLDLMFDHSANPKEKAHGRLAWTLLMNGACWMDLSVMPRKL
jgi:hypothetical protein